jgi:hypothetical protein
METKFKHTPGPWHVYEPYNTGGGYGIDAECGESIIMFGDPYEDCGVRGANLDEAIANSKLIAAGPELLEVIVEYITESKQYIPVHSKAAFIQLKAEKIIKKATE